MRRPQGYRRNRLLFLEEPKCLKRFLNRNTSKIPTYFPPLPTTVNSESCERQELLNSNTAGGPAHHRHSRVRVLNLTLTAVFHSTNAS